MSLERYDPSLTGKISYEHFHRYAIARDFVAGYRVLDVASGEGYGTAILAGVAQEVVGLEIDRQTVNAARKKYSKIKNLSFQQGDCSNMPFEDAVFDRIISFETIEHIHQQEAFVAEVKRLLRPDGLFIVSTPNLEVYSKASPVANEYHVKELSEDMFKTLLSAHFSNIQMIGQRISVVSLAGGFGKKSRRLGPSFYRSYSKAKSGKGFDVFDRPAQVEEPEYLIAFCSDEPILLGDKFASAYLDETNNLWPEHETRLRWASQLHDETESFRVQFREIQSQIELADKQILNQKSDIDQHIAALSKERLRSNNLQNEYDSAALDLRQTRERLNNVLLREAERVEVVSRFEKQLAVHENIASRLENRAGLVQRSLESALSMEVAARGVRMAEVLAASAPPSTAVVDKRRSSAKRLFARRLSRSRLLESKWFDERFYRAHNKDLTPEIDAIDHFVEYGIFEERDPHPFFSTLWYRRRRHGAAGWNVLPFLAFLNSNEAEAKFIHPLLDEEYYGQARPDVGVNYISHFLKFGHREHSSPHALFHMEYWRSQKSQASVESDELADYLSIRENFNLSPHPLFDPVYYASQLPALASAVGNPLVHYLQFGSLTGRNPNSMFAVDWYLANNPDVRLSGAEPLTHYVRYGEIEGRRPHPLFDPSFYRRTYPDTNNYPYGVLAHYLAYGMGEGRRPSPEITSEQIRELQYEGLIASATRGSLISSACFLPISRMKKNVSDGQEAEMTFVSERNPVSSISIEPQEVDIRLRSYIGDYFGAEAVDPVVSLMSIVAEFGENPSGFLESRALEILARKLEDMAALRCRSVPDVTIIIPVHNKLAYTLACLASVLAEPSKYSIEVIVSDDQSSDGTDKFIGRIGGCVKLLRHSTNMGFLRNCNKAAESASGRFLVFLNNDTITLPGWLDELIDPLMHDSSVGLTGSKLLNGDGTLQEAGGIFWNDGSAWNFGRNQDPRLPEFNYFKEADYISGASIAISATLWKELDGFDELFLPAYYEDSDLAFRVRRFGRKVMFCPSSILIHHEGVSHGRNTSTGIKAYQTANRSKFVDRWRSTLQEEHFADGQNVGLAKDRSRGKPHILFIDHYVPQWDRDAGSRTLFLYIKMFLKRGYHVALWPDNLDENRNYVRPLQKLGVEVIYGPSFVGKFSAWWEENSNYYKYVFGVRPHILPKYLTDLRKFKDVKVAYYGSDLHYMRLMQEYEVTKDEGILKESERFKTIELDICRNVDLVLYPSQEEIDRIRIETSPELEGVAFPITIFSGEELCVAQDDLQRIKTVDPHKLMFIGGFAHGPNVDAVSWFCDKVMPILVEADSRFTLSIAGSNPPPSFQKIVSQNIRLLGWLSDGELKKLYSESGISVVPLRYGGGVKGKVIEALGLGIPVVMTDVGAQGIPDAQSMSFIGNSADELADCILQATSNREEALKRAEKGLEFIRANYSDNAIARLLAPYFPGLQ